MQKFLIIKQTIFQPKTINISQRLFIIIFYIACACLAVMVLPQEQRGTMAFYVAAITVSTGLGALSQYHNKVNKPMLFLSFLVMFFLIAFRDASGIDDIAYKIIFDNADQVTLWAYFKTSGVEPGFKLLAYMIHKITNGNYYIFQVICSLIPIGLFYIGFYRYRNEISIPQGILLLYGTLCFQMLAVSLVRMFIAIAIVFNAIKFIVVKRPVKYTLLILIASLFHRSAILMLIFLALMLSKRTLMQYWKQFLVVALAATPLAFILVAKYIAPILGTRYSGYAVINTFQFRISSLDMLPFFLIGLSLKKSIPMVNRKLYIVGLVLTALSCIFSLYSSMVSIGRVIFYANLGNYFVIPLVYRHMSTKSIAKLALPCIVIAYIFLYLWKTQFSLETNIPFLFPYKNIFFEV